MQFNHRKEQTSKAIDIIFLVLSLSAIFLQMYLLLIGMELFLQGKHEYLLAMTGLSGLALCGCAISALLTTRSMNQERGRTT